MCNPAITQQLIRDFSGSKSSEERAAIEILAQKWLSPDALKIFVSSIKKTKRVTEKIN